LLGLHVEAKEKRDEGGGGSKGIVMLLTPKLRTGTWDVTSLQLMS
jgi:hypothetical protein